MCWLPQYGAVGVETRVSHAGSVCAHKPFGCGQGAQSVGAEDRCLKSAGAHCVCVSALTAGNTAFELGVLMGVIDEGASLKNMKWGQRVKMKASCGDWCGTVSLVSPPALLSVWGLKRLPICRLVCCATNGYLFNPYAGASAQGIGQMVQDLGERVGIRVRPRCLRSGLVTNLVCEGTTENRQTDMMLLNNTGGWSHTSGTPLHAYLSSQVLSAKSAHKVRNVLCTFAMVCGLKFKRWERML